MAGLTDQGYIKRTSSEIQEAIIQAIKEKTPAFNKQPLDIQANLIDTSVAVISQFENLMETLFNGYSMSGSDDMLFRMQAEELGLRQKSEFKSQVVLEFTGLPGDIIPRGVKCSDAYGEYEFETQETIIIGDLGKASVLALGEAEVSLPANKINTIVTTINPGVVVNNNSASLPRIDEESFEDFKARSQARLRSPRMGGRLHAETLLKGIEGVNPRLVSFNCVDYTIRDEDNSHEDVETFYRLVGIEAIVGGGDEYQVALALYKSFFETQKLLSNPSDQDANRTIKKDLYLFDSLIPVVFTRPRLLQLNLKLFIGFNGILTSAEAVRQATQNDILNYVNNLKVGTNVGMYKLIELCYKGLESINAPMSTVKFIKFKYCIGEYETPDKTNPDIPPIPWKDFNEDAHISELLNDCYCDLIRYEVKLNALE